MSIQYIENFEEENQFIHLANDEDEEEIAFFINIVFPYEERSFVY